MEIGQAFTFVTEDKDWIKKLAIGALFVIIPFLILLVIGYQILIIRNVIDGKDRPLPEWEDFGQLFMDGLIVFVALFVYALPMVLLSICGIVVFAGTSDPSGNLSGGGIAGVGLISCIAILYGFVLAFLTPAIYIQYARAGEFGPLFQVGEVVAIARENLVDILIVIVVAIVANMAVSLVSSIAVITICGPIIISMAGTAWIMFATGHLYGQIARKTQNKSMESSYSAT
jgi:hypothetical protein